MAISGLKKTKPQQVKAVGAPGAVFYRQGHDLDTKLSRQKGIGKLVSMSINDSTEFGTAEQVVKLLKCYTFLGLINSHRVSKKNILYVEFEDPSDAMSVVRMISLGDKTINF